MPREIAPRNTPVARYLKKHQMSISDFSQDCGLSYRTVWLASKGFRVGYESAKVMSSYSNGEIPLDSLCEGRKRPRAAA
jgi:hypothetical protein